VRFWALLIARAGYANRWTCINWRKNYERLEDVGTFANREKREVANNLSASEKEEATRPAKELGMKSAFFGISCFLILYFLYEYAPMSSNVKLALCLFLFIF
jgi:hypothetical protein